MKTLTPLFITIISTSFAALAATNSVPMPTAAKPSDQVAAPGTRENRSFALSLLKQLVESQANSRAFIYTEEVTAKTQARGLRLPEDGYNGDHQELQKIEARGDGNRLGIRTRIWGSFRSATDFVTEDRCPYNSLLWDGKVFFEYVATTDKPGRLTIETRPNESRSRERIREMLTPLWSSWVGRQNLSNAASLSVRTHLEKVGQAQCYVIDAVTLTPQENGNHTVWIDSERGNKVVQMTNSFRFPASSLRKSVSYSLERLTFKDIDGAWTPIEGYVVKNDEYRGGGFTRRVEHHTITKLTLNSDTQTLDLFIPNDIKNGTRVTIRPGSGQRVDPRDLPSWQDGRAVDKQGRVLFNSSLTNRNSARK